jgi:hypothetical protein
MKLWFTFNGKLVEPVASEAIPQGSMVGMTPQGQVYGIPDPPQANVIDLDSERQARRTRPDAV